MAVPQLRSENTELCDILQAILAFNYHYDPEIRDHLNAIRADIPIAPARRLRQQRDYLRNNVKEVVKKFGCTENPKRFAEQFKEYNRSKLGTLMMPKFEIDKIFRNYADKWIPWESFPPHVLIYLDFTGESYRPMQFDWKLPEASLYEDMCIAYNHALDASDIAQALTVPVRKTKLIDCYLRTATLSAFYFIEGYLNGVAFDYVVRHGKKMSEADAELLLERNKQGRERWISLKDKIYKYQRIILSTQHPPLTETNTPEIKFLLNEGKDFRDAIVHQSPKFDFDLDDISPKVKNFAHLRLADVTQIVDASVAMIKQLNALLGKHGIMLEWLISRDSSEYFPEKAFL